MSTQHIPIEDDPCDVLGKAMRGLDIDLNELSRITDVPSSELQAQLDGEDNPLILKKAASVLGLSETALLGLPYYRPNVTAPDGLEHIVSPYGHAGVNAYVISRRNHAVIIDTGTDTSTMWSFIKEKALQIDTLLVTHRHADHVACIDEFREINIIYPEQVSHGEVIETTCGSITALDVSGHIIPARAYLYQDLDTPICIVGDSIFAGSMGGTKHPDHYPIALQTARENVMSLDEDTVLCPGHGPLTSVGSELRNNPFLN